MYSEKKHKNLFEIYAGFRFCGVCGFAAHTTKSVLHPFSDRCKSLKAVNPAIVSVSTANYNDYRPQVITLTQSILLELYKTIGIDRKRLLIRLVQPFVWLPTRRFAALAVEFDRAVAEHGLVGACRIYLPKYIERVDFVGDENIPCEGPLLVCSNHPGVFNSFAIISRFPRDDLKLIISGVPFTRNVPAASKYLLYVPEDIQGRMNALRSAIHHLQEGGMVMIFPSGRVDPDPALLPGASEALNGWSPESGNYAQSSSEHKHSAYCCERRFVCETASTIP